MSMKRPKGKGVSYKIYNSYKFYLGQLEEEEATSTG